VLVLCPQGVHITRRRGVYHYRRRLPGRAHGEVMLSLRTRRYREAEHRAALLDGAFGSAWRRALSATSDEAQLKAILRDYLRRALEEDLRERLAAPPGRPVYVRNWDGEQEPAHADLEAIELALDSAQEDLIERDFTRVADDVDRLMAEHGLPERMRPLVSLGVLEANVQFLRLVRDRVMGRSFAILPESELPLIPAPAEPVANREPPRQPKPRASELITGFVQQYELNGVRGQTRAQVEASVRLFIKTVGDLPIDAYSRAHGQKYWEVLRQLPNDHHKLGRGDDRRTIEEVIERGRAQGKPTLQLRALQRHKNVLEAFFAYAYRLDLLDRKTEITDGWTFPRKTKAAHEENVAWEPDELRKLFSSEIWTSSKRWGRSSTGEGPVRDWKFWLPLLCLFQGARLEEMAQLYREDIKHDHGVWYFDINDRGDRKLKNAQSRRLLPIHPEIIKLGFLDWVEREAPCPSDRVFRGLKPVGPDRKLSHYVTRWFGKYRRRIGLTGKANLHSFRHNVTTGLLRAGVLPHIVDRLLGRTTPGGGETVNRYYKGELLPESFEALGVHPVRPDTRLGLRTAGR